MTQNAPKISVIIPTHNREATLRQTIRCFEEQTLTAEDYELVVVDDGSNPPVALYADCGNLRRTLIRLEGAERSAARNAGGAAARGDLLVFVDDDVLVGTDFLESHLRAQQEWPGALVVGSIHLASDGMRPSFLRFRNAIEGHKVPATRGLTASLNFCAAGNCSIPRDRFHEAGRFDEGMRSGEDQDLAFRHTGRGGVIAFVPEADALHNDSARGIRSYCRRAEWGMAHLAPFMEQHPLWPDNAERADVNGPTRFGREPFRQSLRKIIKVVFGRSPLILLLFGATSILERFAPDSRVLERCYDLLLGAHLQRGYRRGLKIYGASPRPSGWPLRDMTAASGPSVKH
jgi:glycosyltransferase involved in cell wall biosynthesis